MLADLIGGTRLYREEFTNQSCMNTSGVFYLFLIESGSFSVNDGVRETIVGATDAFVFRPGQRYFRHVLEPLDFFQFVFRLTEPLFEQDLILFRDKERILSTLRMLRALDTGLRYDTFAARSVLLDDLILQYRLEKQATAREEIADNEVRAFLKRIETAYQQPIVLAEEVEKTGLSYAQFFRRFQKATGLPPVEYLIRLRMNKARDLLAGTELPVTEIARSCGYENEFYFSNAFKRRHGVSPTAYRSNLREPSGGES